MRATDIIGCDLEYVKTTEKILTGQRSLNRIRYPNGERVWLRMVLTDPGAELDTVEHGRNETAIESVATFNGFGGDLRPVTHYWTAGGWRGGRVCFSKIWAGTGGCGRPWLIRWTRWPRTT